MKETKSIDSGLTLLCNDNFKYDKLNFWVDENTLKLFNRAQALEWADANFPPTSGLEKIQVYARIFAGASGFYFSKASNCEVLRNIKLCVKDLFGLYTSVFKEKDKFIWSCFQGEEIKSKKFFETLTACENYEISMFAGLLDSGPWSFKVNVEDFLERNNFIDRDHLINTIIYDAFKGE